MNELAKNNRLNHRYSHDELIIKRGIFMLPNSYLVFNDSSKILFRDNENKVDEDINLKISLKDSVSPVLIEDISDKNSYFVIMPMKI